MTSLVMFSNNKNSYCSGFVLIELIIVLAVFAIISAVSVPVYSNLQTSAQLNESSNELIQTIRTARGRAVARVNDAAHGIYLQSDRYTLYQGSSHSGRNTSYDRTVVFDEALTLSNTISGNEINFSRSFGLPDNTGSITITHDIQGTKTITIDSFGSVQE